MTLYPNNLAPFVAGELSLFDKRLTVIPQLRLQIITFAGYPDTPRASTTSTWRRSRGCRCASA